MRWAARSDFQRSLVLCRLLLVPMLVALGSPADAQLCTVPGSHSSIREAIDDLACSTIDLSSQTYSESLDINRSLTLVGPAGGNAVIEGLVRVSGGATEVALGELAVHNGCREALHSRGGARVTGANLDVVSSASLPCPGDIFDDGFESGDTTAWSSSTA